MDSVTLSGNEWQLGWYTGKMCSGYISILGFTFVIELFLEPFKRGYLE